MKFYIKNRVVTGEDCLIVGDNSNYIAEFIFDEEWNGVTKTARFISCNDSYVDVILENDKCFIPCEVLKCGYCRVGVYSSEMTTTKYKFFVTKSVKNDVGCVCEPTPDVYEQIMKKIDDIVITGGVPDYSQIPNKPSINGVELVGNKTSEDLGLVGGGSDPTVPEYVKNITEQNIEDWNNKANKSDIPDVSGFATKGEIPTKVSLLENDANYANEQYVDTKVANLVGTAPETLDTLEEVAKAIQENDSVVEALNSAIGNKIDKSELDSKVNENLNRLITATLLEDGSYSLSINTEV